MMIGDSLATFVSASSLLVVGDYQTYKNSTTYTGYIFVPLVTPLTSTSWDGDGYSTTAKTLIDLSSVFGAPAGIKAILIYIQVRDSASSGGNYYMFVSPNNSAGAGMAINTAYAPNDTWNSASMTVPCDANGDVYYQIAASGANTFDVLFQIFGYWI
jgi:hypothetical protein